MVHTCWPQGKCSKCLSFDTCLWSALWRAQWNQWWSEVLVGGLKKEPPRPIMTRWVWVAADNCLTEMHKRVKIFSAAVPLINVSLSGEIGSCGRSQQCCSAAAEYLYQQHLQPCISLCSPPRGDPPAFIFHWRPRLSSTPTCNLNTNVTHCKWKPVLLTTPAVCVAKWSLIIVTDQQYYIGGSKNSLSTSQQSGSETWNLYVQRTSVWTPHMTAMGKNKHDALIPSTRLQCITLVCLPPLLTVIYSCTVIRGCLWKKEKKKSICLPRCFFLITSGIHPLGNHSACSLRSAGHSELFAAMMDRDSFVLLREIYCFIQFGHKPPGLWEGFILHRL